MAFISEINFKGTGVSSGEFIEITLAPGDDPANFVVSIYRQSGALHTGAGISGGEVTLSTLSGTPDPDNVAYTIYVIPVGVRNANSNSNEGSGISLTDTSAGGGVLGFYSAAAIPVFSASSGAAAGATSTSLLDHLTIPTGDSYQWDVNGNQTTGPISSGDAVLCLTAESAVKTLKGDVPASNLQIGDLVWTLDHGYQPIRWIGSKTLTKTQLKISPKKRPVRIRRHALGANRPVRDLLISPQHRIFARSKVALNLFGVAEILVPAIKLTELTDIDQIDEADGITYLHLLFDRHEIIHVDGALVESLLIAERSESVVDDLEQVFSLKGMKKKHMPAARPLIDGRPCKAFLQRVSKNNKRIFDTLATQSQPSKSA